VVETVGAQARSALGSHSDIATYLTNVLSDEPPFYPEEQSFSASPACPFGALNRHGLNHRVSAER